MDVGGDRRAPPARSARDRSTRGAANAAGAGSRARAASSAIRSGSGERGVVGGDAGAREELGDHRLVHVGVLPQVEHREVEAEDLDRADQRREAPRGERRRAVQRERRVDRAQVGEELVRRSRTAAGRRAARAAGRSPTSAAAVAATRA